MKKNATTNNYATVFTIGASSKVLADLIATLPKPFNVIAYIILIAATVYYITR